MDKRMIKPHGTDLLGKGLNEPDMTGVDKVDDGVGKPVIADNIFKAVCKRIGWLMNMKIDIDTDGLGPVLFVGIDTDLGCKLQTANKDRSG